MNNPTGMAEEVNEPEAQEHDDRASLGILKLIVTFSSLPLHWFRFVT
jgi:hypothetical protein